MRTWSYALALLLLIGGGGARAQQDWGLLHLDDVGVSVRMPTEPATNTTRLKAGDTVTSYQSDVDEASFTLSVLPLPKGWERKASADAKLDDDRNLVVQKMKCRVRSQQRFWALSVRGLELVCDTPDNVTLMLRQYAMATYMIRIMYAGPKNSETGELPERFFESFRFMEQYEQ